MPRSAGFFFSLAYAFDAASALFAVTVVVLLWGGSLRTALVCCAAAIPVVALQAAFNVAISGSIIPTAYNAAVWTGPVPRRWASVRRRCCTRMPPDCTRDFS